MPQTQATAFRMTSSLAGHAAAARLPRACSATASPCGVEGVAAVGLQVRDSPRVHLKMVLNMPIFIQFHPISIGKRGKTYGNSPFGHVFSSSKALRKGRESICRSQRSTASKKENMVPVKRPMQRLKATLELQI